VPAVRQAVRLPTARPASHALTDEAPGPTTLPTDDARTQR